MKRTYRYLTFFAFAVLIAACMKILQVNHPDTAPVNTGVDASIDVEITITDGAGVRTTPVVGILAPVVWNFAENAKVTYTTSDGSETRTMRLATGTDLAPDGNTWYTSMKTKLGAQDNYEPVEWIPFIATTNHAWKDKDAFTGTVKIHFTTGAENLKTNLAYFIGNTQDGVNNDKQYYLLHKQLFETTGGENTTLDYTLPKTCSITPEAFTWEDIVAIHCDQSILIDGKDSPLKGADKVYLMMRASYEGKTKEVVVDQIGVKTLMTKEGKDKWMLYLYPHEFFAIPAGVKIDQVSFYMVNADKSIQVKMPNGSEFTLPENNK